MQANLSVVLPTLKTRMFIRPKLPHPRVSA